MIHIDNHLETGAASLLQGVVQIETGARIIRSDFAGPTLIHSRTVIGPDCQLGQYVGVAEDATISRYTMGNYCSIGRRVSINPFNHPTNWLSIHEFQWHKFAYDFADEYNQIERLPRERAKAGRVEVGSDVWIGNNAVILSDLKLGTGCIVGAQSVVTQDVPPYAIVAGVPARIVRYRFEPAVIERLLASKWWERPLAELSGLPFDQVEKCLDQLTGSKPAAD